MNTQLETFSFHSSQIRTIAAKSGEIYFVAKDVAVALGYADATQAVKDHCKKAVNYTTVDKTVVNEIKELHRTKSLVIPESDVYRLVIRSKLEQAEEFQDWVCDEVLPSIRKHGAYISENSEFAELQALLNSSFANPLPLADVIKLRANVLNRVDKLIKQVPLRCTMAEWEQNHRQSDIFPAEASRASIHSLSETSLSTKEQFNILLERHLDKLKTQGSSDNAIRSQRSTYRKQFRTTGIINPTLYGQETSGRKSLLSTDIQQRFIEMVKNAADETHADYLPLHERKVTHFQTVLELEFNQPIKMRQLYCFVRSHGLQSFFLTRAGASC